MIAGNHNRIWTLIGVRFYPDKSTHSTVTKGYFAMTVTASFHSEKLTVPHQQGPTSKFLECEAARAEMSSRCATVMELLTDGHSNKEIAARLRVSMATVKAYVSEILRVLNVDNRTQAALIGLRLRYGLEIVETRLIRK